MDGLPSLVRGLHGLHQVIHCTFRQPMLDLPIYQTAVLRGLNSESDLRVFISQFYVCHALVVFVLVIPSTFR